MSINNKIILEYSKNLTVLYVEDEKALQTATAKLFQNYFKRVDLASEGEDGLNKYLAFKKESGNYYDIVIADINMPKMNGIEMSKLITQENDTQSIIFTTAYNEVNYLLEAIEIGVSGFLLKPLDLEQLKRILYKTSQSVSEHRFIDSYYQNIEAINVKLMGQNRDLKECENIGMIVDDLVLHKSAILREWVDTDIVKAKLRKHVIDNEYFKTHFAEKVFDYFIGVVRGQNKVGNCPVIATMLEFFKHKNLPLESIFIICSNFKNAVTFFISKNHRFDDALFHEIAFILDRNFEGVITQYMSVKLAKYERKIDADEVEVVVQEQKTSSKKIDYSDYVFEHDIYEMKDLETEIDNLVIKVTMDSIRSRDDFAELGFKVKKYGQILISYPIFEELGSYIIKLGNSFIDHAQILIDDTTKISRISILVEGFVNDLIIWRKEIFEDNIAEADFLNASFFSNVSTIIHYIEYDENATYEEEDDDGMEFF